MNNGGRGSSSWGRQRQDSMSDSSSTLSEEDLGDDDLSADPNILGHLIISHKFEAASKRSR
jgi:hypothetical protein